jgi:hypothetical protein
LITKQFGRFFHILILFPVYSEKSCHHHKFGLMFFIKKLFRIVNSSSGAAPESGTTPADLAIPVKKVEDTRPLVCDNKKSGWAKKRIPENLKHLPNIDIEI